MRQFVIQFTFMMRDWWTWWSWSDGVAESNFACWSPAVFSTSPGSSYRQSLSFIVINCPWWNVTWSSALWNRRIQCDVFLRQRSAETWFTSRRSCSIHRCDRLFVIFLHLLADELKFTNNISQIYIIFLRARIRTGNNWQSRLRCWTHSQLVGIRPWNCVQAGQATMAAALRWRSISACGTVWWNQHVLIDDVFTVTILLAIWDLISCRNWGRKLKVYIEWWRRKDGESVVGAGNSWQHHIVFCWWSVRNSLRIEISIERNRQDSGAWWRCSNERSTSRDRNAW